MPRPYQKRRRMISVPARSVSARLSGRSRTRSKSWASRSWAASSVSSRSGTVPLSRRLTRLESMIETKQSTSRTAPNVAIPHNNFVIIQSQGGGDLNMFVTAYGTDDPMGVGGRRIGDEIAIKGVKLTAMFENAISRPKVFYRLMLVKSAKGDTLTRTTLFQDKSQNKMLDTVNTERYTILFQRRFTLQTANPSMGAVDAAGQPVSTGGNTVPGQATKIITAWIPGRKFGRNGVIKFENNSQTQVKFFDYRWVLLCYDWYGTPQDVNNVGRINELFTTAYYKDA